MTTGQLVELAAVLTAQAPLLIGSRRALSAESLTLYWLASKCRQQRWAQSLKQAAQAAGPQSLSAPATAALVDEIFVSEVLTRVVAAIVVLHDRQRQTKEAEPIARSVWLGHLESRRRALMLLADSRQPSADGEEVNRRRRRAERWNDILIGCLRSQGDVDEFAFDPETAAEFADDFRDGCDPRGMGWALLSASLRAVARDSAGGGNHDLHQQIGAAVLGCFGHEAFDSLGLPQSLWASRLLHTADSVHGLVERLFATDRPAMLPTSGFIIRRSLGG